MLLFVLLSKVWWYIFDYTLSNKILFLSTNWLGKHQLVSSKYEDFRMIFELVRKSIFEHLDIWTYMFCVIIWDFYARYNQSLQWENNFILFCIFIMLHLQTLTPLILLSVNFGLPGENVVTSTIFICNYIFYIIYYIIYYIYFYMQCSILKNICERLLL